MDFDSDVLDALPKSSGHGGARRGAGRKPAGYVKPQEVKDFEIARGRNEAAKASLNELEYKIKTGQHLPREAIQQAAAMALASLAQSLRSIPDALESEGVPPDICEAVSLKIDTTLDSIADDFEMMVGEEPSE